MKLSDLSEGFRMKLRYLWAASPAEHARVMTAMLEGRWDDASHMEREIDEIQRFLRKPVDRVATLGHDVPQQTS